MSSARRYLPKYSVADYQQWPGDWELWNGTAVSMTPSPFGPHQRLVSRLIVLLAKQFELHRCSCEVISELDWIVSNDTVVRPDVMVLCNGLPEKHLTYSPTIIAEVLSPATAEKDRTAKRDLYQLHDVPFYLLIDPDKQTVEAYCRGRFDYEAMPKNDDLRFELHADCVVCLKISELFAAAGHN